MRTCDLSNIKQWKMLLPKKKKTLERQLWTLVIKQLQINIYFSFYGSMLLRWIIYHTIIKKYLPIMELMCLIPLWVLKIWIRVRNLLLTMLWKPWSFFHIWFFFLQINPTHQSKSSIKVKNHFVERFKSIAGLEF